MHLSTHFTLAEMTASQIADRHGWDNMPATAQLENLERLCREVLEPIRRAAGPVIVSSGYRCKRVNDAVGSKDTSAHLDGRAADIKVSAYRPLVLARMIEELDLPLDQTIHEFGAWVHVGIAAPGALPRRQLLTIDRQGTRPGLLEVRK